MFKSILPQGSCWQKSVLVTALLFAFASLAFGQTDKARISGTVKDGNGGVIPGASVVAKNDRTGAERTTATNEQGEFSFTVLEPSIYTVTVSGNNFSATKLQNVQAVVGQERKLDVVLKPVGQEATIDVTASDSLIDTSSARIGANVDQREVQQLPLNGRQLSQLYLQAPGAQNTGEGTFADIRFSGRANQQNVIRYDGIEGSAIIDASPGNLNGEVPSPFRLQTSLENVQEFRVDSNNFPAEYGTGTGGQVSVISKSGSNAFHGSVFEYFRNARLDARNFFDGPTVSPLRLNQFGTSVGGPIAKDKAFFFISYEGYRLRSGVPIIELAPALDVCTRAVNPIPNCSPATTALLPAFRSPQAVVLQGLSTDPNFDLLRLTPTNMVNENAVGARFDVKLNPKLSFYGRYYRDQGNNDQPEGITGRHVVIRDVPQNAVIGVQQLLTPSLVNETKIGYNSALSRINGVAPTVSGTDLSGLTFNITGSIANPGIAGQGSSFGVATPGGLVRQNSATNGRGAPYTPYSVSYIDDLSWTKGSHNAKFGGEIRAIRLYTDRLGGTTYSFSNLTNFVQNVSATVQFLGDLSAPSPFNNGATGQRFAKQNYYIVYAQDEWKIRPNVTLNYGLRYEYYTQLHEDRDLQILFDIKTGAFRNRTEEPYRTSKNNFGPRIAATWSPNPNGTGFFGGGKSVFRGGFGIYYGPGQTEDQIQPIESDRINSTFTAATNSFPQNPATVTANFLANPTNRQYQPRAYSADYLVPERVYSYTFSYQQELPGKFVMTAAYVGSRGRNLFLRSVTNTILPGTATVTDPAANFPTGVGIINVVRADGSIQPNVVRQFDIVSGRTISKPFAEVDFKTSGGFSNYDAFQMSFQRRYNAGLTLNGQYTYAKNRGNSAGSNEALTSNNLFDFNGDIGFNNFDIRNLLNVSAIYTLPFGKGKKYLGDLDGVGQALLGNWEIGGILNARSGFPVNVLVTRADVVCQNTTTGVVTNTATIGGVGGLCPSGSLGVINTPGGGASRNVRRPDLVQGVDPYININGIQFLNPAAFATPRPGTVGNLERNKIHGPGFSQFDMNFVKRFRVTESTNIEFRTEVFNIFNNVNFANPVGALPNALGTASNQVQPGQPFTTAAAGTFGRLTSTLGRTVAQGTSRQVQFALRINF